jgi:hypothetical protein
MAVGSVTLPLGMAAGHAAAGPGAPGTPVAPGGPGSTGASLCAPPPDTVPPAISTLTLSSQTVDVSSGPQSVTVTVHATDTSANGTASGVQRVFVDLSGPRDGAFARLKLASGTTTDGTWTGTLTIPSDARSGTWLVRDVSIQDAAGNEQSYSQYAATPQSPYDPRLQSGWQTELTVTGTQPPPPTVTAGRLSDFEISPAEVDTTHASAVVQLSARFSGRQPRVASVDLAQGRPGAVPFGRSARLHRSGREWTAQLRIPRWLGDHILKADLFAGFPRHDRPAVRRYDAGALRRLGFASQIAVTSGVDTAKPSLTSLALTPTQIDTTGGPEQLTVTATATDALSGVRRVVANLFIRHGSGGAAAGLYPYPGFGYASSGGITIVLKPHDGQWVGTGTFQECEPGGQWHLDLDVQDHAGNVASYSAGQLAKAGLPSGVSVTSTPGDVEAPYVKGATASGIDHTITIDFTEGVKNVSTSTLQVYPREPAAQRYTQPAAISAIVCSNGSAIVDCSGSSGLVTSAVLTVPNLTAGADYEVFGNPFAVTPQLTDGNGNPLYWNDPATEVTGS